MLNTPADALQAHTTLVVSLHALTGQKVDVCTPEGRRLTRHPLWLQLIITKTLQLFLPRRACGLTNGMRRVSEAADPHSATRLGMRRLSCCFNGIMRDGIMGDGVAQTTNGRGL